MYVLAAAWLAAGIALLALVATAPGMVGGWARPVTFVTLTWATWIAAGSDRAGWLLPGAVLIDGVLAGLGLHGFAGFVPGPWVLMLMAATPGAARAWRHRQPPTAGMLAVGAMVGGGTIVLIVAAEVMAPLAPAWSSLWLALTLPLALAAAGIRRGGLVVGVLVCEPPVTTAISIGAAPDVGWSDVAPEAVRWGSILAGNLVVVAVVALLVVGIDRSLAAERPGLGLLVAVNIVNVLDAVSTWLLLGRGEALELNPLMDHPLALVGKVVGVAAATVWLRRHRPAALLIPLAPLVWVTVYHLAGWVHWAR